MDSEQFRKLFIGGLHLETDDDSLRTFYEKWGEVVDCVVMRDPNTRRSRGFGFITYSSAHMVDDCLAERPHVIDTKQVDAKRAMPREESGKPEAHAPIKKVFVGGIKDGMDESQITDYFSQFGNIQSVDVVTDRETGKKRGFAFVTFDDTDSVDKIVLIRSHMIGEYQVEVKKAMERDQKNGGGRGGGAPRGGRGRGGYGERNGGGYSAGGYGGGSYGGGGGYGGGSSAGGYGGYGGGADAYSGGYGASAGGYGQGGAGGWGGYGNGYTAGGAAAGGGFGSGYSGAYGGGAMKSSGYSQRAAGPYGGGYGGSADASAGYGGYGTSSGGGYAAAGGAAGYGGYGQPR